MDSNNGENDDSSFQFAMQLASASVLPMVLKSAIELDLLELIARAGPGAYVSPSDLAAQLPTSNPAAAVMLDRILRLLACHSILECKLNEIPNGELGFERLYALAPVCKFLIKNEDGVCIAPLLLMNHDKAFMQSWYYLKNAILDGGIPFHKANEMSVGGYMSTDPMFNKVFNNGMSNSSTITMKKILEIYKGFEGIETLVDVGGGTGATLNMIISKYPTIKGINFDLPHVIKDAPSYPGVEHIGGDMFVSVPKGDALFIKSICQGWSDEHCLKLLKNCYDSLPMMGNVILVEYIMPMTLDTSLATKNMVHVDLMMLAHSREGKGRTLSEFETLAKGVGFRGFRVVCCAYNTYVMELVKNI